MVLEGRRCDGYAGASSATLGPVTTPAREAPVARFPGNPVGLPETLLGSRGSSCGTRVTAFSAPAPFSPAAALWALPSAVIR
jgi:hypothetical protein